MVYLLVISGCLFLSRNGDGEITVSDVAHFRFFTPPRFPSSVLISAYQFEKTMKIRRMSYLYRKMFVDVLKVCLKEHRSAPAG